MDQSDFTGALGQAEKFTMARLCSTTWRKSNFQTVILDSANLENSDLGCAHFPGGSFKQANLARCDLGKTFLVRADLTGASLAGTFFSQTDLRWAKLNQIELTSVEFNNSNLFGCEMEGMTYGTAG